MGEPVPASGQSASIPLPVAIGRYLEVSLYLLVLTGFGTLASTGGLDLPTVFLVGATLLLRGYLLGKRRSLMIPERWTTILTLAYVGFYLVDYFILSQSFLNATVHLVLFVMVIRLFSARRDRDYYFLAVIAFLMVLAGAVLTVDSVFLVSFAAFVLMAVMTFILMEMRHASSHANAQSKDPPDLLAYRHMGFSLAGTSPVLVCLIMLGAGAIFFVLPRASTAYLSALSPHNEVSTGFSDTVRLGRIGQIQESNAVVMHVQIDGDQGGHYELKWRGISLSLFDGTTWSNPHSKFAVVRNPDGSFILPDEQRLQRNQSQSALVRQIHYRVVMEPIGAGVFFVAARPRMLTGNYRMIGMDAGGAVFDLDPEHPVSVYEASSLLTRPDPSVLRASPEKYPPEIEINYLQLPDLDPRIPELARRVTAKPGNSYDKATALEQYLRTNFAYTLQQPPVPPKDPLATFLFERKRGHCEYFASAMAIMLRTLGIPSRIVNGFQAGEFNDLTDQYVVRGRDAHSWVEAYFPGAGWVTFDPTPGGSVGAENGLGRIGLYLDAMSSFWREWVINYDSRHQAELGWQATRSARTFLDEMRSWTRVRYRTMLNSARQVSHTISRSPTLWTLGALFGTLLLVMAANLRRIWRLWHRSKAASHPASAPALAATVWYQRMTRLLAKRGWRKTSGQTAGEFLPLIDDEEMRNRVAEFTRRYERARFGESAEDASKLPQLYQEIVAQSASLRR
jgi:hypothetical protein